MKKRLYDFTVGLALAAVAAYGMMLVLFGYTFFSSGQKPIFAVVFVLLIVSFLFLVWYFVILAAQIGEEGISQGQKRIAKDRIQCRTEYNLRFREGQIVLRDKTLDYTEMNPKYRRKKEIRIQATAANIRKLSDYLGKELTRPKKPARRAKRKREEPENEEKQG